MRSQSLCATQETNNTEPSQVEFDSCAFSNNPKQTTQKKHFRTHKIDRCANVLTVYHSPGKLNHPPKDAEGSPFDSIHSQDPNPRSDLSALGATSDPKGRIIKWVSTRPQHEKATLIIGTSFGQTCLCLMFSDHPIYLINDTVDRRNPARLLTPC